MTATNYDPYNTPDAILARVTAERDELAALLRFIAQGRRACMEAGVITTGAFVSSYNLDRIDAALARLEKP